MFGQQEKGISSCSLVARRKTRSQSLTNLCAHRARGQFRGNEIAYKVYGKTLMDADLPRMAGYRCVENVSTSAKN